MNARALVQGQARRTGAAAWWNGSRQTRDKARGLARGLVRGPSADTVGWGFRVGHGVYLGVHPEGQLHIGEHVTLYDRVRLNVERAGARVDLGDGVYLNSGTQLFCRASITIGDGSAVGFDCLIMDTNFHELDGERAPQPVVIGHHVWLGARVTVLPGVSIGDGAVVGAGSIVSTSLPPGQLAVGSPARAVRPVTWTP